MSRRHTGLVVGKDFRPPEGAQPLDWCFLTVDIADEDRISVRITRDQIAKADIGDVIQFRQPRHGSQPVPRVVRLYSDPTLLPSPHHSDEDSEI